MDSGQLNGSGGVGLCFGSPILCAQEGALHAVRLAVHPLERLGEAVAGGVVGVGAVVGAGDGCPFTRSSVVALNVVVAHADLGRSADGSTGKSDVELGRAGLGEGNAIAVKIITRASIIFFRQGNRTNAEHRKNDQNKCQITLHKISPFVIHTYRHRLDVLDDHLVIPIPQQS